MQLTTPTRVTRARVSRNTAPLCFSLKVATKTSTTPTSTTSTHRWSIEDREQKMLDGQEFMVRVAPLMKRLIEARLELVRQHAYSGDVDRLFRDLAEEVVHGPAYSGPPGKTDTCYID